MADSGQIKSRLMRGRGGKLALTLVADSGYECSREVRITADQWGRICNILAEASSDKGAPEHVPSYNTGYSKAGA